MSGSNRFLALGDSYTIGESVAESDRWPTMLARLLRANGEALSEPEIIARTGWTTGELEAGIAAAHPIGPFALVTILIGVNNQYRGGALDEYRVQFRDLVSKAVAFAGGSPGRVIVLSIPDWGVTPFAEARDHQAIAAEIDAFNATNREEATRAGAAYLDVTAISRRAAFRADFTAQDGLHPSAAQYRLWAELALPLARAALGTAR